jgi:hypothetical protein
MLTKKESIKNEVKTSKATKDIAPFSNPGAPSNASPCPTGNEPQQKVHAYTSQPSKTTASQNLQAEKQSCSKAKVTKVTVLCDAGFPNNLFIRGHGANLNWEKGQLLKNVSKNEWVWETDTCTTHCEFKILINDCHYEKGENHHLKAGNCMHFIPHF